MSATTLPDEVGQHVPMADLHHVITGLMKAGLTLSGVDRGYSVDDFDYSVHVYTYSADEFARAARLLASFGGRDLRSGAVEKRPGTHGLELHADHGTTHVRVLDVSGQVCRRVLVGTDTVTEEVPDPDHVAPDVPMVTVTREVPRYEWECPPSVLAVGGVEAEARAEIHSVLDSGVAS